MEVPRVGIWIILRLRSVVSELDESDRPRLTDDRTADLLAYLARQGIKDRLRSVAPSTGQDMWTVFFKHEDRPTRPGEDRARRHDELKRRLLIGEKTREEEPGHSPDDIPGGNRGQVVYFGQ
jgi:hypothetical protein